MRINRRNLKIAIFFGLLIFAATGLLIYNVINNPDAVKKPSYLDWTLTIKGNVKNEIDIPYTQIVNGTYYTIENAKFHIMNNFGREWDTYYTGISLWDLLNKTNILNENSSYAIFKAIDGYVSTKVDLSTIRQHKDEIIIAYKENGEILKLKDDGGDGPLHLILNFSVTDPNPNTPYNVKYLNEIEIF